MSYYRDRHYKTLKNRVAQKYLHKNTKENIILRLNGIIKILSKIRLVFNSKNDKHQQIHGLKESKSKKPNVVSYTIILGILVELGESLGFA